MTLQAVRRLFQGLLIVYLPILWIGSLLAGEEQLVGGYSVLLATFLDFLLLALISRSNLSKAPLIGLLTYCTGIFYLSRILGLMFFPESVKYQLYVGFESADLERALTYLLLGTAALAMGLIAGSRWGQQNGGEEVLISGRIGRLSEPAAAALTAVFIFIWVFIGYLYLGLGRSYFNVQLPVLFDIVGMVDGLTAVSLLAIVVLERRRVGLPSPGKPAMLVFFLYLACATLKGGKGGVYDLLTVLIMHSLCSRPRPGDAKRVAAPFRSIALAGVTVVLGAAVFVLATRTRAIRKLAEYEGVPVSLSMVLNGAKPHPGAEVRDLRGAIGAITDRLSLVEPLMLVVGEKGVDPGGYVSLSNDLKSAFNRVVPGTYFHGIVWTEQAFSILYRGATEGAVLANYQGDEWSCYGLMLIYFGYWGGLVAVFVTGVIFAACFSAARRAKTRYAIFLQVWIMALFSSWFNQLGLDNLASRGFGLIEGAFIYLLILSRFPSWAAVSGEAGRGSAAGRAGGGVKLG